jgi:hypothetical protein
MASKTQIREEARRAYTLLFGPDAASPAEAEDRLRRGSKHLAVAAFGQAKVREAETRLGREAGRDRGVSLREAQARARTRESLPLLDSDGRLNPDRTRATGNLLVDVLGEDAHLADLGD